MFFVAYWSTRKIHLTIPIIKIMLIPFMFSHLSFCTTCVFKNLYVKTVNRILNTFKMKNGAGLEADLFLKDLVFLLMQVFKKSLFLMESLSSLIAVHRNAKFYKLQRKFQKRCLKIFRLTRLE